MSWKRVVGLHEKNEEGAVVEYNRLVAYVKDVEVARPAAPETTGTLDVRFDQDGGAGFVADPSVILQAKGGHFYGCSYYERIAGEADFTRGVRIQLTEQTASQVVTVMAIGEEA